MSNTFNILSMDGPAFRRWAQLMQRRSDTRYEDGMIAAGAKVHQLTVVNRNVGDFSQFEVPLLNSFTSRAELGRSADWGDLFRTVARPGAQESPSTSGARQSAWPHDLPIQRWSSPTWMGGLSLEHGA